jgi:hypothetical protein
VEIFLPGGLDRQGDGWKLSVRIRLVHARIRHLLAKAPEWDAAAWGVPISSAHVAYAGAVFSAVLLKRAEMLGVRLDTEERASFMMIWRYGCHLMGVPDGLLFATEADALHLHEIGGLCEPPPTLESILLANGLINSAPIVANITKPRARRALVRKIYKISRAMIGDELADRLNYPPMNTFGALAALRVTNGVERVLSRIFPAFGAWRRASKFQTMLTVSLYVEEGIRYRLPGHVHAEKDASL